MIQEKHTIVMYLPDIIAFILPQVGFITFILMYWGLKLYEINTGRELLMLIYIFWLFFGITGLIGGIITRNSTDGYQSTFLSGVIGFPIIILSGYVILFMTEGLENVTQLISFKTILIFVFGVIIGIITACFGYIGGKLGEKVFSYSQSPKKKSAFELIKSVIKFNIKE
ncbi:MAG: hypothetical protein ACFFB5_06230 [Promethearchaeota archaeon]